ncbi:MAG: hypothetical protein KC422_00005 [Trueperaceae bacterium]|nr:hypothetical protein [Trueperaceae bacterium]
MNKWFLALVLLFSLAQAQRLAPLPPGQDGWLFHQDEYGFYTANNPTSTQKALEHIVVIKKLLEAKGIQLIVSLTPAKIGLYEDKLPEDYPLSSSLQDRYNHALEYLRAEGVLVADVKTAFAESEDLNAEFPLFQRLDHHWSSKGALLAAQIVADSLKENAAETLDSIATVEYSLTETGESPYTDSSLYNLASPELKASLETQGYYPEEHKVFTFERLTEATTGLFGDSYPEIALVGASFSNGEPGSAWPFYSALQYSLSKEIVNVAQTGKGPWEPMSDYLNDITFSEQPPKIVIWEVWELFLEAFGQANLSPDWLINSSAQLSGACSEPLQTLSKVRSNGLLDLKNGIFLLNSEADTYLEFRLESASQLDQYLSFTGQFEGANSRNLSIEVSGEGWTRQLTMPIQEGYLQHMNVPLYPEGGNLPQSVRIYPGESERLQLSEAQLCTLPDYVIAALSHPLDLDEANVSMVEIPSSLFIDGLRGVEANYGRWGLGPTSELSFYLPEDKALELAVAFSNQIAGQGLELRFNGELVKNYGELSAGDFRQDSFPLAAKAGLNRLELAYRAWNGLDGLKTSDDSSPFAAFFQTLGFFEPGNVAYTPQPEVREPVVVETPAVQPGTQVIAFLSQDMAKLSEAKNIVAEGFSAVEDGLRRWALGPGSNLTITTPEATTLQLDMSFYNPIEGQSVDVSFNGQTIESISGIPAQTNVDRSYTLQTQAGTNTLSLAYSDWNLNKAVISEQDTRPMAVLFNQLAVQDIAAPSEAVVPASLVANPQTSLTAPTVIRASVTEPLPQVVQVNATPSEETLTISGLAEPDNNQFRWSLGPETRLDFLTNGAEPIGVDMAFFNPIDGQNVTVRFNGAVVQELTQIDQGTEMSMKFFVNSSPGMNYLSISYSHVNGDQITFAPNDNRPLGILYKNLDLLRKQ